MSIPSRKIILVASQSDVTKRMTPAGYAALLKIGAKKPFKVNFRGSFAFIGYSGRGRPSYVQQVICHSICYCEIIYQFLKSSFVDRIVRVVAF